MKTSAKEGSPMLDCSLNTAIFRTASSSLPRRSTSSGILMLSILVWISGKSLYAQTLALIVINGAQCVADKPITISPSDIEDIGQSLSACRLAACGLRLAANAFTSEITFYVGLIRQFLRRWLPAFTPPLGLINCFACKGFLVYRVYEQLLLHNLYQQSDYM